jgi:hypothetical protein
MQPAAPLEIVPGRSCEGCTMCCKVLGIAALQKPVQEWCSHCTIGKGCRIYETRPAECARFYCSYLLTGDLGEEWKPANCRMVLGYEQHANRIVVHVDASRADAWKKEPFYAQIKTWAKGAARIGGQVVVWQGLDAIVVLPDRDVNLGRVKGTQVILMSARPGGGLDVTLVDQGDPRLKGPT